MHDKVRTIMSSKKNLTISAIVVFAIVLLKVIQYLIIETIIINAFNQDSFSFLNEILEKNRLKDPDNRTLTYYLNALSGYINRLIILALLFFVGVFLLFRDNKSAIKSFYRERAHPDNFDVFRIVFFSYILLINFPSKSLTSFQLGKEALVPPFGWSWINAFQYPDPVIIQYLGILFTIICVFALIGFLMRVTLPLAAIFGFVILGIPQFYGKIDHYHVVWHVMLILAVTPVPNSRLSIDYLLFNKERSFEKTSWHTAFIINSIILLIGINYFFPGVWKFVFSGFEWAFSENLKHKMYAKWIELDGWRPWLRIDQFPVIYKTAALITIVFELTFVFALFFKRLRPYFVVTAIGFHIMVALTMKIFFWQILILYVALIDWGQIFSKVKSSVHNIPHPGILVRKGYFLSLALIISGYLLTGALLINSWPFAVNPTFASIEKGSISTLVLKDFEDRNTFVPLLDSELAASFESSGRYRGFIDSIVLREDQDNIEKLLELFLQKYPEQKGLKLYLGEVSTDPDLNYPVLRLYKEITVSE